MKRNRWYLYAVLASAALVLLPSAALSEMVVTTWQFTIDDDFAGAHADAVFDAGDSAFISLYYDDATGIAHDYDDGPDGIAWTADDIVTHTYNLTDPLWGQFDLMADVDYFTTSSNLHDFLYTGSHRDTRDAPASRIAHNVPYDELEYIYRDDSNYMRFMINNSFSVIRLQASTDDSLVLNDVGGTLISVTTSPVPVPGALLLGSLGLGVAGYRLRRRR